ncbi:hypothetical protein [Caldimonas brevitalea]|uniref:Uncharacterized protein n=1 Tax=Caldimonas brevitalea TaxID=413882 RepID=A0A0G3BVZ8_9BURK|nr:hypothetical protein [Caldimonas brevitalea]AKJ31551.1 hypothetical protein AAW51_4860 [Caldimonas brevitalea]
MEKSNPPEALGAFKPVGHVVVSFPSERDLEDAVQALGQAGFSPAARYTPEQMRAQVDSEVANASVLANFGQELNLAKAHGELADQGYSFLVVEARRDEQAREVAAIVQRFHAARAQKYGRFLIEELIDVGSNDHQVFESPDRGLDAQTRSGREGAAPPR